MNIKASAGRNHFLHEKCVSLALKAENAFDEEVLLRLNQEFQDGNIGYWCGVLRKVQDQGLEIKFVKATVPNSSPNP